MRYLKLWALLALVILGSFSVLSYFGLVIYRQTPPIPKRVVIQGGQVLFTASDLLDGQNVWQSMGGQEVGTIWGHGAYVAPDWNADWLHRESLFLLDRWALADHGQRYSALVVGEQAALCARLAEVMHANTYDRDTGDLVLSADRAAAFEALSGYYGTLFGDTDAFPESVRAYADGGFSPQKLREAYAIPRNTIPDAHRRQQMSDFFFWSTWATTANRPGSDVSYTQNWPAEPLVANAPTGSIVMWSLASFVLLLAGIGALAWYHATLKHDEDDKPRIPDHDPLLALRPTPSMKATLKYFWVVVGLILAQVALGMLTAHYSVEGEGFFGFPLAKYLPYVVTRTWHTQLGIFWIATAWLATGLFIAPAVSGYEPRFQRAGVNFLFVCLLIIIVGSCFGTWYATRQRMGLEMNFWFGHQGYEYVDLGRFWQLFLFVGLFVWLGLMTRAIWPAFKQPGENKHMLGLFLLSSSAIALFYGAGLMWGRHTHLAMAEYWRWWVVHLWVEGFFEVFATVVIAFLFTRMGLLRTSSATVSVLFATSIFLAGGIIGTFHHLYFSGTPTAVLALGAVFSALEVVPLTLIGFEAYENLSLTRARPWVSVYRWPIYFFVAVAFWNLVGAGLFGFLINPPIALYYMQGMNTTPVHGHAALFGVYGMLGIGLTLFCLKGLTMNKPWRTGSLKLAFWSLNLGLVLMIVISMLPVGLMQAWASITSGVWHARSAEFLQTDLLRTLRWMRVFGDITFSIGIAALAWFVLGLKTGWSIHRQTQASPAPSDVQPAVQHA